MPPETVLYISITKFYFFFFCLFPFLAPSCSHSQREQRPLQAHQSSPFILQIKRVSSLPQPHSSSAAKTKLEQSLLISCQVLFALWQGLIHTTLRPGLYLMIPWISQLGQKGCEGKECIPFFVSFTLPGVAQRNFNLVQTALGLTSGNTDFSWVIVDKSLNFLQVSD